MWESPGAYPEQLKCASLGQAPALMANSKQSGKGSTGANTQAYY